MEDIVYLPSLVEFESERSGADFIQYFEGAVVLGGKLFGWSFGANIFGVEQDPVSWVDLWCGLSPLVVIFAHSFFCFFQGFRCFLVYGLEPVSIVFGGGVFGVGISRVCHEYGRYKYSRPGNMDVTIVFESWITIQD